MSQFLIVFYLIVLQLTFVDCLNAERKIYDYVINMTTSSKAVRPVKNYSDVLTVNLGVILQQLVDVDEKNQIIVVNVWQQLEWNDEYVTWNPQEFNGVTGIRLSSNDDVEDAKGIWKPDIFLYNSVDKAFDTTYKSNMVISVNPSNANASRILWIPPGIVKISCKIDITYFPFDDQWCFFQFGSWTYSKKHLILKQLTSGPPFDDREYIKNGEWDLIDKIIEEKEKTFSDPDDPYSVLKFKFRIRRKTLYYGFNLIIPGLLISLITLLGFALPVECGEKITLEISIIPSICVFLQMVTNVTPPTSEAIPLLGVFFTFHMFIVSASVVSQVLVLNLHYRSPATHEMSPKVKYVFLQLLPWLMAMKRPGHTFSKDSLVKEEPNKKPDSFSKPNMYFSRSMIFAESDSNDNLLNVGLTSSPSKLNLDDRIDFCLKQLMINADLIDHGFRAVLTAIQRILHEIKFINDRLKRQDDLEDEKNNWKFVAVVVDRLCFYIFSFFIFAGTSAIVISAPRLV